MSSEVYRPFYVEYSCDGNNCYSSHQFDLEDDQYIDWKYFNDLIKQEGWITRKIKGEWMHFCSDLCLESVL